MDICTIFFTFLLATLNFEGSQAQNFDLENTISEIFGGDINQGSKCESMDGELGRDCYECYFCDNSVVNWHQDRGSLVNRLRLNNASCGVGAEVCCIAQKKVFASRSGGACGAVRTPNKLRSKPSQIIEGEYPWMATIYKKIDDVYALLCGATFMGEMTLLTAASCVDKENANKLFVSFSEPTKPPKSESLLTVNRITVHEQYKKGLEADVAVVKLSNGAKLPANISPLCLPDRQVLTAAACLAPSEKYTLLNAVVLKRSSCQKVGASQICTVGPPGRAFLTQIGSALFSIGNEGEKIPEMAAHGIATDSDEDGGTLYTNVMQYRDWIYAKITE